MEYEFKNDYDFNESNYKKNNEREFQRANLMPGLGSVFGYMFIGLLLTGLIAVFLPILLFSAIADAELAFKVYIGLLIGSAIGSFISLLVAQLVCIKEEKGGLVCFLIYATMMGILMSSFVLVFDMSIIGYAFLCAAGSFGVMAIYGVITKGDGKMFGFIGFGLMGAVLLLSLTYWIMSLVGMEIPILAFVISLLGIIMFLAFTAFDVIRAKEMAKQGTLTTNLAAYFALQIYTDFIYLFIRILYILSRFVKRD